MDDGEKEQEEVYIPTPEEKEEVKVETVKAEEPVSTKSDEEVIIEKKPLAPKTEYKSSLEEFADSSKKTEKQEVKKHKKKDKSDRRRRAQ